jgi:hypothetical protein
MQLPPIEKGPLGSGELCFCAFACSVCIRYFCIIRSPASLQDNCYFHVIFRISQSWDCHFSEPRLSRHRNPCRPNWLSRTPIAEIHQEAVHLLTLIRTMGCLISFLTSIRTTKCLLSSICLRSIRPSRKPIRHEWLLVRSVVVITSIQEPALSLALAQAKEAFNKGKFWKLDRKHGWLSRST